MSDGSSNGISGSTDHKVVIIGSGFAGLAAAVKLKQMGITDFVVLERASDVGGTWRDNSYPGCQCDVASDLYSLSFAPNPNWSRLYSKQPEILEYIRDTWRKFNVINFVRFNHNVEAARWDDEQHRWTLETSKGVFTAQVLVAGTGPLNEPSFPEIQGRELFQGPNFHTCKWDHSIDLKGKRVAVIGTGASAIQVIPNIQPAVGELHVYQRTPPWVMPHPDRAVGTARKTIFSLVPQTQQVARTWTYRWMDMIARGMTNNAKAMKLMEWVARNHIRHQVPDPVLRQALTPNFSIGCKRILMSNIYYPALSKPNVTVITDRIGQIKPHSIVTASGQEREVDIVIYATGFEVADTPISHRVWGRNGLKLADLWKGSPHAYLGTAIPSFPNLFLLIGPNSGLGSGSMISIIESQVDHLSQALQAMQNRNAAVVEVRADVEQEFNDRIQRELAHSVWNTGGCASWYLDRTGRNAALHPGTVAEFERTTRTFNPSDYNFTNALLACCSVNLALTCFAGGEIKCMHGWRQ